MARNISTRVKIDAVVEHYVVFPCGARQIRAGNEPLYRAYQHRLQICGHWYSFITDGRRQWSFKSDTVAFEWAFSASGGFRNIYPETFRAWDAAGTQVIRGNSYEQECKRTWGVDPHTAWLVLGSKCCMAPNAGRKDCDPDCLLRQSYRAERRKTAGRASFSVQR